MSELMNQLLLLFGIDFANNPITNLAEFIPFATKLLLGAGMFGMLFRFIFSISGDAATGKML